MNHQEWSGDDVRDSFEEAVDTLRRLPREIFLGYSKCWPDIVYSAMDKALQEPQELWLGPPLPDAIDRMNEALKWLFWVEEKERRLIWMRAERVRWKLVARRMGVCRNTAVVHWKKALAHIALQLNDEKYTDKQQFRIKSKSNKQSVTIQNEQNSTI